MIDIDKLAMSLGKLKSLNVNIPEIIAYYPTPANEDMRVRNESYAKAFVQLMRPALRIVLPNVGFDYLDDSEAKEELKDYKGEALIILKAPKSKPQVEGFCSAGPYYNTIELPGGTEKVLWGQKFVGSHEKAIMDLCNMTQRVRLELDGSRIRFSYHDKGAGVLGDKIVLWGEINE